MGSINNTLAIILAGGKGTRLQPLTTDRAKPAVPFGGQYRIIDFTLANCLHSGIRRILVLTQYKSHSLQKHLRDGWSIFNPELGEYITPVPAQMRTGEGWYSGTADAIHQNLYLIERGQTDHVLILSGDHIYRMDYAAMLAAHRHNNADLTVACMEVPLHEAHAFGNMKIENNNRIVSFIEKPQHPIPLDDNPEIALVSMGIYIFSTSILMEALQQDHDNNASSHDFGKDIVPSLISSNNVYAYRFGSAAGRVTPDRYWRDVGTIDAYYQANMDLLEAVPAINLYQDDWPIRTYQKQNPPARTVSGASGTEGIFINSIVAGGSIIAGGSVQHSILFPQVYIGDETQIEDSILLDRVRVGNNCMLKQCIVDKYVNIPDGELIGYDMDKDRQRFSVSDNGVVVVPKGYVF